MRSPVPITWRSSLLLPRGRSSAGAMFRALVEVLVCVENEGADCAFSVNCAGQGTPYLAVMVTESVGAHGGHNPPLPPADAMSGEEHVDIRRMGLWSRRKMPRHEPHYLWGDDHFMGDTGLFRHHIDGV